MDAFLIHGRPCTPSSSSMEATGFHLPQAWKPLKPHLPQAWKLLNIIFLKHRSHWVPSSSSIEATEPHLPHAWKLLNSICVLGWWSLGFAKDCVLEWWSLDCMEDCVLGWCSVGYVRRLCSEGSGHWNTLGWLCPSGGMLSRATCDCLKPMTHMFSEEHYTHWTEGPLEIFVGTSSQWPFYSEQFWSRFSSQLSLTESSKALLVSLVTWLLTTSYPLYQIKQLRTEGWKI